MTAEIHSIAAVINRLGNATYLSVNLDDDGCDFGASQKLQSSRQAGRSGAGYDCNFLWFIAGFSCCVQRRSHFSAVIEVPILPSSGVFVTQGIEAYIFRRNDKSKLRIGADCDQILGSKRTGSGCCFRPPLDLTRPVSIFQSGSMSGSSTCERRRTSSEVAREKTTPLD